MSIPNFFYVTPPLKWIVLLIVDIVQCDFPFTYIEIIMCSYYMWIFYKLPLTYHFNFIILNAFIYVKFYEIIVQLFSVKLYLWQQHNILKNTLLIFWISYVVSFLIVTGVEVPIHQKLIHQLVKLNTYLWLYMFHLMMVSFLLNCILLKYKIHVPVP